MFGMWRESCRGERAVGEDDRGDIESPFLRHPTETLFSPLRMLTSLYSLIFQWVWADTLGWKDCPGEWNDSFIDSLSILSSMRISFASSSLFSLFPSSRPFRCLQLRLFHFVSFPFVCFPFSWMLSNVFQFISYCGNQTDMMIDGIFHLPHLLFSFAQRWWWGDN